MATINNKLIHFKSKSDFNSRYAATTDGGITYGDFLGTSIVFIQDAKQIWTHGQFYDANEATLASLGITVTAAELNYLDGATSNIQSQLNEIEESVDSISDPYEINLTNLLSAEDSESISTAIGGIDNLNATVQDNRIIVGTISNGNVSVSIRILGNVTTLYYLLDSVVGLTLNEIAITNTSGTLSKSVTTHSVITENMVINSLESDETTLPLSAAQGKVLATDKQNKTDSNLSTTNKTITGAINEIFPKATGVGKIDPNSGGTGEIFNDYVNNKAKGGNSHAEGSNTTASGSSSHAEGDNTEASNISSHAEGYKTFAAGGSSHAEGSNTRAINSYEHAQGFWNNSHTNAGASRVYNTLHSIGIGTSNSDRKNAQEVSVNGDHYIIGIGNYDGTNPKGTDSPAQTLQEVVNGKQNTLVSGTSIKTINGESLLGSGDITIETGSSEVTWDNVTGKPSFAAVATSGSYSDLTGTPNLSDYVEDTSILGEPCVRIKDVEGDTGWVTLEGTNGVTVTVNSSPGTTGALDIDNVTVSINPSEVEDQSFATTSKTLTGAINELKEGASGSGNGVYYLNGFGNINLIDYDNLETVKQSIQTAIGGLDNFVQALQDGKQIIDKVTVGSTPTDIPWSGFSYSVGSEEGITAVMIVADNPLTCRFGDELLMNKLVQATTNIAIASNDQYQFMIFPAEFRLETKTVPNVSALLKSYFYDYYVSLGSKITGDYTTMCMPVLTPITINGMAYSWTSDDDIMIITGWSIDSDFTQTIEEYKIDIGASSPGSTSETTYKSCSNVLCINSGESTFWRSQTTGTTSGTLQQNQYDLIKRAIDNGCSIVIDTPHPGYIEHFQSVSSSKGSVEGEYTFCYLDYDTATNNFFIKWFKMKSDLTCQVYTKIL